MKKRISIILILCMLFLGGCAGDQIVQEQTPVAEEKTAPMNSPWGESATVQKEFERIAGASKLGMTSGQELLLLDYMERYYQSIGSLDIVAIRDLFATEQEAAFHRCIWRSIVAIRQAAREDLSLTGYSYTLMADKMDVESEGICTVVLLENNVQYFAALDGVPSEQWKVKHTFTIQRLTGDRWVIKSHLSEDAPFYSASYDAVSDTDLNLDALLGYAATRCDSNDTTAQTGIYFDHLYDRGAAKTFMLQYVTRRDGRYPAYDDAGGNCMNFGSQVLLAGGIPMDRSGPIEQCWYNYGRGRLTKSFINVGSFLDYAAENTGTGLVAQVGADYDTGEIGDIITMGLKSADDHTTVICDVLRDGEGAFLDYLLCSNTANLRNFPAGAYYYTNQQLTKILGWND